MEACRLQGNVGWCCVFNSQIPMIGKHKPVPPTTYEYPKDHEALDRAKENNHKVSQVRQVLQLTVAVNVIYFCELLHAGSTHTFHCAKVASDLLNFFLIPVVADQLQP